MTSLLSDYQTKYKHPEETLSMVLGGKTKLLNPAYNEEYGVWLEKMKPVIVLNTVADKDSATLTVDMIGLGGVGNNICTMLEKCRLELSDGSRIRVEAFDYDTVDITNYARLATKPTHKLKLLSAADSSTGGKKIASADASFQQTNIEDSLFIDAANIASVNTTFIGAPTLSTRASFYEMGLPFFSVTHLNNKLMLRLNATPTKLTDLAVETYGKVQVDFFLPATHLASMYIAEYMLLPTNKLRVAVEEYLQARYLALDTFIFTENLSNFATILYNLKTRTKSYGKVDDLELHVVALETRVLLYTLVNSKEGRDILCNHLLNPDIEHHDEYLNNKIPTPFDINHELWLDMEEKWKRIDDICVATIEEAEVEKFLLCESREEARELMFSLVNPEWL